ncbi:MAG: TonB-dependent receptor plug domain-containing protein [Candidatus Longimicrobiales bacterium M2_2A_002]
MTVALALGVLFVGASPVTAQASVDTARTDTIPADTFSLPDIVVTATRVPLAREAVPVPVSVWTRAELEARGIRTVAGALAAAPSATVVRTGSRGSQTSLFLRGGESDYVKVLIDGVVVNDPGGAFDFADLSTDQVERIEVVRGPVSVLYGSDAVAGVVQIFTRRGAGSPAVTAQVTGGRGRERGPAGSAGAAGSQPVDPGAYGIVDAEATVTGSAGELAYTVGGSRSWSGGQYPFNNERGHTTGTARLAWAPGSGTELAVTTRYTDSRSHFPTDGTGALVDRNARLDRELWTTSAALAFRLHDRVDARIRAGLATRDQRSVDAPDGPADTLGTYASTLMWELTRRTVDARLDWELPVILAGRTVASAGVAWEAAEATSAYDARSDFGPMTADADYRRATIGYYAQLLARPVDRVHLTLGGRVDDSDTYGTYETFRAGVTVEPVDGTRVRGAWGRGFKEPSFDQVFGSGFGDLGNPDLDPERSRSWELGVEQSVEVGPASATASATWFDQRFDRLIQFTFSPPAADDPNYFNVGAASSRGLELEVGGRAGPVAVTASYTHLETEVLDPGLATDAGFVEGEPLLRRPADAGHVTARYTAEGGTLALSVNAVGEREDLDFAAGFPAPRVTLPGYTTVDLSAERTLPLPGPTTTALLRIENALDAEYQSAAGFPGLGRVVRVGLRMRVR